MNSKSKLLVLFLFPILIHAQKKPINHEAYNSWKKIEKPQLSHSGNLVSYEITPLKGDGFLYIYDEKRQKLDSFYRGKEAKIASSDAFIAFKVSPGFDTLRKAELKKLDKKKYPKDSLFVWVNSSDSTLKFPKLKNFEVPEFGSFLAFTIDENERPKPTPPQPKKWYQIFKKSPLPSPEWPSYKSDGNKLFVWSPNQSKPKLLDYDVTEFEFSKNGKYLSFIQQRKGKEDSIFLRIIETETGKNVFSSPLWKASQLPSWDKETSQFAVLYSQDTTKTKQFTLFSQQVSSGKSFAVGDTLNPKFDLKMGVSEFRRPAFSENQPLLFFGISPRVEKEIEDSLLDSEKVRLDIWHFQDETIQPQQLVNLKNKKKENYLCVFNLLDSTVVQLSSDTLQVSLPDKWPGDFVLGVNRKPYSIEAQWKMPIKEDVYRVQISTGEKILIKKGVEYNGKLSPNGKYYTYFNPSERQHYAVDLQKKEEWCLTCSAKNGLWDEFENGLPMLSGPEEIYGFDSSQQKFYFSNRFDLWEYNFSTRKLEAITKNWGEQNNTILKLNKWSKDSVFVYLSDSYISGFHQTTKKASVFRYDQSSNNGLFQLWTADEKIVSVERNKQANSILFRTSTLEKYPEITLVNNDFKNPKTISITNPQQAEYQWAKVDLVEWEVGKRKVQGLLYKPEDYNPSQKYPLIVYYYELLSENLHQHQAPRPSASTINPLEYAASGYLVLIPDIYYEPGYPAKSAYTNIMSGTDHIIKKYSVDEKRMGLQGQSWGGYQTLQMITMTNRYQAAMAGAPVGNMFSAYGGIRWGTGLNRQFQYECTQSRIGKTIWEAPELYVENSPLFHLPKVTTPLLIMHNDKDGAVPWYQGIEIYTAMRRLQKPCWMLNYNDDDHNLMKAPNRVDLAIRMRQFFDHYLLGLPAPQWMKTGIPAIEKGKITGYATED